MKNLYLIALALLAGSCSLAPAVKIHLSVDGSDLNDGSSSRPLATPHAALEAVKAQRLAHPDKDIRVIAGPGTWFLNQPLVMQAEAGGGGKVSVTWEGDPGGGTVFSAGQPVTNFRDAGYGIWWAAVDSTLQVEQLYIDDMRAVRARIPNAGDSLPRIFLKKSAWIDTKDQTERSIRVELDDRGLFTDLMLSGNFEVVVFKDWTTSRFRASGLDAESPAVTLKPPFALFEGPYNSIFAGNANRYSCFLEGDPAFLDRPGEWVADPAGSRIYYKPLPGQRPESVRVIAPVAEQILVLKGTSGNPVKNLKFSNISFLHAAYRLPAYSHDGMQAAYYYPGKDNAEGSAGLVPPAVEWTWASDCSLDRCTLRHIGGNGISLSEGCSGNRLSELLLEDIGGNGIMVGLTRDPKSDSSALPRRNSVTASTLRFTGTGFQGSVGIWMGFCAENEISGCELHDMPYTGISVGWQWNPLPTSAGYNRILNNKIHHVMKVLGDGGGIYTLGFQPGSVISGNEIHDILRSELNHASPNNGMFIDEGSKGYLVENNTIRNTAHTSIRGHRAAGVELRGNTFYSSDLPAISHTPPYEAMIFANRDTTITWPNPGWPAEWGYPASVTAFTMSGNRFR